MADVIKFPEDVYLKAKELPTDQRMNLAGQLAAEVLKRYPHLTSSKVTGYHKGITLHA